MCDVITDEVNESEEVEKKWNPPVQAHIHGHNRLLPADVQARGLLGLLQRVHTGLGADGTLEHDLLRDLRAAQEAVLSIWPPFYALHFTSRHLPYIILVLSASDKIEVLS